LGSAQSPVRVAQDRHGAEEDVLLGVATTLEPGVVDPAGSTEIDTLLTAREVVGPVVLGQSIGAYDPEIGTSDGVAVCIEDGELGLHWYAAGDVEHAQEAFIDRVGQTVHQRDRSPE
jgi:hypothetical protein